MPVDFFINGCKSQSNKSKFGLCDDAHPALNPAYINEIENANWIGIVNNPLEKQIDFYAIDHCIEILKPNGLMEKRCDGMLHYNNRLIFIELKSRKRKGNKWLKDGSKQLETTISVFKENQNIASFEKIEAYVCNQLKPRSHQGHFTQIQKFKEKTGLILRTEQIIKL